jgi:hypothetical protein
MRYKFISSSFWFWEEFLDILTLHLVWLRRIHVPTLLFPLCRTRYQKVPMENMDGLRIFFQRPMSLVPCTPRFLVCTIIPGPFPVSRMIQ